LWFKEWHRGSGSLIRLLNKNKEEDVVIPNTQEDFKKFISYFFSTVRRLDDRPARRD